MPLHFEPPPVYFMHIPKTGGVTLGRYWLRHTWPGLTEGVKSWRTTYPSQQKQEDRRP